MPTHHLTKTLVLEEPQDKTRKTSNAQENTRDAHPAHPKTSEVKVFQLRKKKGSMPTQENSWKRSFSGAFPELFRGAFPGSFCGVPAFCLKFSNLAAVGSKSAVKVHGRNFRRRCEKWSSQRHCNFFLTLGQVLVGTVHR